MAGERRGRVSPIRLVRALWRYRGQLEGHGAAYQAELATTVHSTLDSTIAGRVALRGYRLAMRTMVIVIVLLALISIALALALWQLSPWAALVALLPAIGAGFVTLWRLSWGAPIDWLDEHADRERTVTLVELPSRLRALARETRSIANVPARLADELDALAGETERESG